MHRQDLDREHLDAFVKPAAAVRSHPSLALMVDMQPANPNPNPNPNANPNANPYLALPLT